MRPKKRRETIFIQINNINNYKFHLFNFSINILKELLIVPQEMPGIVGRTIRL